MILPLVLGQLAGLVGAVPDLVTGLERRLGQVLAALDGQGLLTRRPEEIATDPGDRLTVGIETLARSLLENTMGLVLGTVSFAFTSFAAVVVAAMLLANARDIKASFLKAAPLRYRADARALWDDLAQALSRYLGGLALILVIQGAASAVALWLIGVPYPLALGAWVSITAVIPYVGAWIGAVPAVLVAFSVSPEAVVLTIIAFVAIQQLEGNVLTPRIQGQTIGVPSLIIFLAVLGGGALFGLLGMLFALPALAVLRVLFDFLGVRLRVVPMAHRVPLEPVASSPEPDRHILPAPSADPSRVLSADGRTGELP